MPKITKATARRLVRKHCSAIGADRLELDSSQITIWFQGEGVDHHDGRDQAEIAAAAIAAELGAATVANGSKIWIDYKGPPADLGDWNDSASRWHY